MYPRIEIKIDNIIENAKKINSLCKERGVKLSVVTKLFAGNKEIVKKIVESGIESICESRIDNLQNFKDINVEKWLIRSPMISEIEEVVSLADVSLNSEFEVIKKLDEEARKQGKIHKVILMYELGDLREGCLKDELDGVLAESLKLQNIEVYGIGANLSCYGEILPDEKNMNELVQVAEELEQKYNFKFKVISGGNSSSYNMLKNGELPDRINSLRFGEAVFLGNVPCFEIPIDNLNRDNFTLKAEIIEIKNKPSVPWGKRGCANSFGEQVEFEDRGIRKRAIIAIGKQDIRIESIRPKDKDIILLDGSSDHIILDITDSEKEYKIGDVIEFSLSYPGILMANTSNYVKKVII